MVIMRSLLYAFGLPAAAALLILIIPAGIAAYLGAGAAILERRDQVVRPE